MGYFQAKPEQLPEGMDLKHDIAATNIAEPTSPASSTGNRWAMYQGKILSAFSADQQLDLLVDSVAELQDGGVIDHGNANALTSKLNNANKSLDKGNANAAANQVQAFINQVNALIGNGTLTQAEGDTLIGKANAVITSILPGLHAAERAANPDGTGVASPADVQGVLDTAIAYWQQQGANMDRLQSVTINVANLTGSFLGLASSDAIWIDADAAGYGWSLDGQGGSAGMDLLWVVTHELGHVRGFDHYYRKDVMGESLNVSERLVPGMYHDEAFAGLGSLAAVFDYGLTADWSPLDSSSESVGWALPTLPLLTVMKNVSRTNGTAVCCD